MLVLDLLGTLSLRNETHPVPVAAQQKRPLGLLAILGLSARQGLSRDRIEAYLWPESSSARAQHALDQTVYAIRHALGSDVIVATGRELRLNPDLVRVDAWEFEQAIRAGQWTAAVGHYKGPLLDGFYFADSHELESWIDTNRTRLRLEYQKAIEFLANLAAEARDHSQAVIWLRRLANSDPLSAGATKKLMLALAAAGDRAGAVQYARVYQELVRQELEMEPDSEIEDLAAAFGGPRSQLLIRARNQLHAIAVPGTEGATSPFFSPDGRQVGFLRDFLVQIASLDGGPPITVLDSLIGVSGASWGPDNFIYADAFSDNFGLLRVEAKPGARPSWFTTLDTARGEIDHAWPDVLPNGEGVLFTVRFRGKNGARGRISLSIAVADIPSGKHRVIVDDAMYARYTTSGHLLYVTTNKTLMVVPFDQNSMRVTGEPTALTAGMRLGFLGGSADLAVSATGTLVYATGAGEGKQELVWVTRDGKARAVDPDWPCTYVGFPALSPDGKWLAVTRVANAEPSNVWTKRVDGGAPAVMQLHRKGNLYNARWSPDGKWLLFQTDIATPGAGDILGIRPGMDTAPVPVVATPFTEMSPAFSPNGRWLAYASNETGADEIYVVPFPNTGAGKRAISAGGGTEPLWSHRGNELFYRDASGDLVAVEVHTNPTFSLGRSVALFPAAGFSSLRFIPQYAVALDDRRFLMIRPLQTGAPDKLIVVENWFEELRTKSRK